jgi:hypothetical protein
MIRANILRRGLTRALSGKAPAAPVPAVLPDLPYAYGALEPAISGTIMEVHHTKHHAAWVDRKLTFQKTACFLGSAELLGSFQSGS